MKTHYSNVKSELESLGYSFTKDVNGWWNCFDNGVIINSSRWLGELLSQMANDLGVV